MIGASLLYLCSTFQRLTIEGGQIVLARYVSFRDKATRNKTAVKIM